MGDFDKILKLGKAAGDYDLENKRLKTDLEIENLRLKAKKEKEDADRELIARVLPTVALIIALIVIAYVTLQNKLSEWYFYVLAGGIIE